MSKLYEIIELSNGDITLQTDDPEREPLVVMKFSSELKRVLRDEKIDLAKAMVEAGLEFVAKLAEERAKVEREIELESDSMSDFADASGISKRTENTNKDQKDTADNLAQKHDASTKSNLSKSGDSKSGDTKSDDSTPTDDLDEPMISHLVH